MRVGCQIDSIGKQLLVIVEKYHALTELKATADANGYGVQVLHRAEDSSPA